MEEKSKIILFFLIIFTITFSFSMTFYLIFPDYRLIGKSEREKQIEINPKYFELIYYAYDIAEPKSKILFLELKYYLYALPVYYPILDCNFLSHEEVNSDQEFLDYIKVEKINYILIFDIDFPFSSNTTYFYKYVLHATDPTRYLLEINRTAL